MQCILLSSKARLKLLTYHKVFKDKREVHQKFKRFDLKPGVLDYVKFTGCFIRTVLKIPLMAA